MEKEKTINRFFVLLLTITLLAGLGGFWILHETGHKFGGYISIPLYFFIFGLIYISMLKRAIKQPAKSLVRYFVSIRMFKLFTSLIFVIIYGLIFRSHMRQFVITFLFFYIMYMVLELAFFWGIRTDNKKNSTEK